MCHATFCLLIQSNKGYKDLSGLLLVYCGVWKQMSKVSEVAVTRGEQHMRPAYEEAPAALSIESSSSIRCPPTSITVHIFFQMVEYIYIYK